MILLLRGQEAAFAASVGICKAQRCLASKRGREPGSRKFFCKRIIRDQTPNPRSLFTLNATIITIMQPPFLIKESIRFGWQKLREHSALVFAVVLILLAVQMLGGLSSKVLAHSPLGGIAQLLLLIIQTFISVGATMITLKLVRNIETGIDDLFPPVALVWRCFAAGICSGIVTIVPFFLAGFFFAIVLSVLGVTHVGWIHGRDLWQWLPLFAAMTAAAVAALWYVFYFVLRFSMVRYAVLDGAYILESLEKSSRLTHGVKRKLLAFMFVLLGLNILGAMALVVGLLITIPVSALAVAHVYTVLNGRIEAIPQK